MEEIKSVLRADAVEHARHGLTLRHVWRNADDLDEILFIFTTPDLGRAKTFIEGMHKHVRSQNPGAPLPQMLYLKGEQTSNVTIK